MEEEVVATDSERQVEAEAEMAAGWVVAAKEEAVPRAAVWAGG